MRLLPLLAVLAVLAVTATPAAAAAPKLKRGIYDCMAYNYGTGFSDYKGSIKLRSKRRYQHAFGREGTKMEDKTSGRYRQRGARVRFKRGALDGTRGQVKRGTGSRREPFINLLLDGEPSGISCYYVRNP